MPLTSPSRASQRASTALASSLTSGGGNPPCLQTRPVDDRHAAENFVEILRVSLRHRQPFAATFGTAQGTQLGRALPITALHQIDGNVTHFLVRREREIDQWGMRMNSWTARR